MKLKFDDRTTYLFHIMITLVLLNIMTAKTMKTQGNFVHLFIYFSSAKKYGKDMIILKKQMIMVQNLN